MAISFAVAVLVGVVSLFLVFLCTSFLHFPSLRLPPGPRPLPIVGNLLMMRKIKSLRDIASELKDKYGPIVTFWVGSTPIVFISGPKLIQEALIDQGSVFMGRSRLESTAVLSEGYRGLVTGDGERHKFLRKLVVSGVLSRKRVAECGSIRDKEVEILIQSLKKQLGHDGKDMGTVTNFRAMIRCTISNLLVGILFGRRLTEQEHAELDKLLLERLELVRPVPRDFLPLLALLPDKQGVKIRQEAREKTLQLVRPLIEERKEALKAGKTERGTIVDTLLGLQAGEIQSPVEILDSDVVLICMEILNAGTDTTALNLEFCMANLINHPEIQEKLAKEISSVVGERAVKEDDTRRLPYLQAVVQETLRRHSPAPVTIPRRALSATKVAGYDIPADALLVQHVEAVSLNPKIWEDPLEFRPERFLSRTPDISGSTELTMIPFGVGRRICPGIHIAIVHAELILARLIQAFEWRLITPGQVVDLTASQALSSPMKYPLAAQLQERVIVS